MSSDLVWLTIAVNAIIATVTIANTWALAWYNRKQVQSEESQADHAKSKAAEKRANRSIILPAVLMLMVSIAGIGLSIHSPSNDVTTQILHISGSIGGAVLSIVFILFGFILSLLHGHYSLTGNIVNIIGRLAEKSANKTNESS